MKKVTLLEKLLDKTSEALGVRKKGLQRKMIDRSLDKTFDEIEGAKIDAETEKVDLLERLARISSEDEGVELFKELTEVQQTLDACEETRKKLQQVKDELNEVQEEEDTEE